MIIKRVMEEDTFSDVNLTISAVEAYGLMNMDTGELAKLCAILAQHLEWRAHNGVCNDTETK